MNRIAASIGVALLVLAGALQSPIAVPVAAQPDQARVTVTDVTITPATPVTGEPVTLSVTVRNSAGSPSPVELNQIAVRTTEGRTLVETTDPGSLSAGDTLTLDLTTTFERAGEQSLVVVATGTDENDDETRVTRPLSVVVERAPPSIDVEGERLVEGNETEIDVTVSNPTTAATRNLSLSVAGDGVEIPIDRRSIPTLAAGTSQTETFTVRPMRAGNVTIESTLTYTTAAGVTARTSSDQSIPVTPLEADVGVRVGPAEPDQQTDATASQLQGLLGTGGQTTADDEQPRQTALDVTVTNFGNAPARNVVVTPVVGEQRLARYGIEGPLAPGESGTVTVDLATVRQSASITFEVGYETGDRNGTATVAYTYRPATGQIRLTGLDLAYRTNGTLEVSGNAGNTGEADVTGVIISVGTATGVEPAYPSRDYFVGTVEGSEFAPFELTASVDAANATTIPLVVNYTVDGVAYSRTVEVPYDERLEPPAESGGRVSPAIIAVGTAAMLALVGAAALGVTRWRDQNR